MTVYATLAEARAFGVTTAQADDATLTTYLELASRVVDFYTGTTFDPQGSRTVTVSDVRTPLVRLPVPFSSVTAVTVNGQPIAPSGYIVEPWGLRLYINGYLDVDGFPRRTASSVRDHRAPYGSQVAVTATFGWTAIPSPVKQATALIAREQLGRSSQRPTGTTDVEGNPSVLPVEATIPGITLDDTGGGRFLPRVDTTEVITADRLLQPYRSTLGMVG